ncbi:hypothetical protein Q0N12_04350 [Rossellomorea marisflavi]
MISNSLIVHVADADFHTKMEGVEYSTDIREIVTLEYMLDNPVE